MMSAFEKASARPATPLFQVQPSGWPSISQRRIGLPCFAAACRACHRSVIQGMPAHWSSLGSGLMTDCNFANCSGRIGETPTGNLPAWVFPDPDAGGYSAEIPALPGCYTQGETLEEVRANLREAAEGWLAAAHDQATAQA